MLRFSIRWLTVFLLFPLLGFFPSMAFVIGVFEAPNLQGYALERVRELDKDGPPDGVKETRLEIYVGPDGAGVGKYVTGGKLWAYAVRGNLKNLDDSTKNYVIVDSDGDGVFDLRFSYRGEEFYLPKWVKGAR